MSQPLDSIRQRLVSYYKRESSRLYPYRRYFVLLAFLPTCCVLIVVLAWNRIGGEPPGILGNILPVSMVVGAGFWALACMCFLVSFPEGHLICKIQISRVFSSFSGRSCGFSYDIVCYYSDIVAG
jgi:hypothetical protein